MEEENYLMNEERKEKKGGSLLQKCYEGRASQTEEVICFCTGCFCFIGLFTICVMISLFCWWIFEMAILNP